MTVYQYLVCPGESAKIFLCYNTADIQYIIYYTHYVRIVKKKNGKGGRGLTEKKERGSGEKNTYD